MILSKPNVNIIIVQLISKHLNPIMLQVNDIVQICIDMRFI